MKTSIAIVGSGISGLFCAYVLSRKYHVTLFEADTRLGGHTDSHDIKVAGQQCTVDTGFIVFNKHNYPNFIKMLKDLNVDYIESDMGISVENANGFEFGMPHLRKVFANKKLIFSPKFMYLIYQILKFNYLAKKYLKKREVNSTLDEFLKAHRFSDSFIDNYLIPLTSAIWSSPPKQALQHHD